MIIFFYGEDTFRSRTRLREQIKRFKDARDPAGYNVVFLNAKSADIDRVQGELVVAPFLAEKRMVVIDNILSISDKKLLAALIEMVREKKVPESTVAVFWQGETVGKTNEAKELLELLKKEKYAEDFTLLPPLQMRSWVAAEIATQGGKINGKGLDALVAVGGSDMWLLDGMVRQLVAFANGAEITAANISLFAPESTDDNVFALTDALAAGNSALAIRLLSEERRAGLEDGYIFAMIVRQFRIILQLRAALEESKQVSSEVLAKRFSIHPFVVKKSLPIAERYSLEELTCVFQALLHIDEQTKTGRGDQSLLVDMFTLSRR